LVLLSCFSSFLESLSLIPILAASTSPAFHLIIPSLPGYAFSSPPPLDRDFGVYDAARLVHKHMVGLGFGVGYAAQEGDIGSIIASILGVEYEAAKSGYCLNFCHMTPQDMVDSAFTYDDLTDIEKTAIAGHRQLNLSWQAILSRYWGGTLRKPFV